MTMYLRSPLSTKREAVPLSRHCERSEAIFVFENRDCFVADAPRNDSVRPSAPFSEE
jgi:hypothetical protein